MNSDDYGSAASIPVANKKGKASQVFVSDEAKKNNAAATVEKSGATCRETATATNKDNKLSCKGDEHGRRRPVSSSQPSDGRPAKKQKNNVKIAEILKLRDAGIACRECGKMLPGQTRMSRLGKVCPAEILCIECSMGKERAGKSWGKDWRLCGECGDLVCDKYRGFVCCHYCKKTMMQPCRVCVSLNPRLSLIPEFSRHICKACKSQECCLSENDRLLGFRMTRHCVDGSGDDEDDGKCGMNFFGI